MVCQLPMTRSMRFPNSWFKKKNRKKTKKKNTRNKNERVHLISKFQAFHSVQWFLNNTVSDYAQHLIFYVFFFYCLFTFLFILYNFAAFKQLWKQLCVKKQQHLISIIFTLALILNALGCWSPLIPFFLSLCALNIITVTAGVSYSHGRLAG